MTPIQRHVKAAERFIPRGEPVERRLRVAGAMMADLKARADAERKRLGRDLTEGEMERLLNEAGAPEQLAQRYLGGPVRHDLAERYLASVQRRLPQPGATDIVAELREDIAARIEAREGERGSPAGVEDVAAILKDYGPPAMVANRYAGRSVLIGEDLSAFFWPAQRTVFGLIALVVVVLFALRALSSSDPWTGAVQTGIQAANQMLWLGLLGFAQVTLVFILLEQSGAGPKLRTQWNPARLPADHVRAPKTLFDSLFNLAADILFLLAWTSVIRFPNALLGDREHSVTLHLTEAWGPVGGPIWLSILGLGALSALVHAADVLQPAWSPVRAWLSILARVASSLLAGSLLAVGPLVEARVNADASARLPDIAAIADQVLQVSLVVAIVIWLVQAAVEGLRLLRVARG